MFQYYPHEEAYIDIEFREAGSLADPDQDATFYVEIYDGDDVLQDTFSLSSTPAIEQIETGRFKVEGIDISAYATGIATYKWYAKQSGSEIPTYPVLEKCFEVLDAVTGALCTLTEVKEHLRITSTQHDTFLTNLITRVSGFLEDYCHRAFSSTEYTEWRTGDGERDMILENKPVTAITTIQDVYGGAGFEYDDTDEHEYWECEWEAGVLYLLIDVFPSSPIKGIKIVYTAGYATTPEAVRQVAIELVAQKWYLKDKQKGGQQSSAFAGQYIVYRPEDLTPMMRTMLAPYRRQEMGTV